MNLQAHIIGPAGSGKTMIAKRYVQEQLARGVWVFVHDPGCQFVTSGCIAYPSFAAWQEAARASQKGGRPLPRGASIQARTPSEIVEGCRELGERHNRSRVGRGGPPPFPMLLVIDESTLLDTSGSTWVGKSDAEVMANRRHFGIGIVMLQQHPGQLPAPVYRQATDLILFNSSDTKSLEKIEEVCLPPKLRGALVERVPELFWPDRDNPAEAKRPADYVHLRPGRGFV